MKKVFLVLSLLLIATLAQAAQVTLTWDAPTTNADGSPISNFAGRYTIYYGLTSGAKTYTLPVTNTASTVSAPVSGLTGGTLLYFHVTATNTFGNESADSNIISKTPITATFTLTAAATTNGTISPAGITTINTGLNQTYTITPATGYTIASVLVDSVSVGKVTTYTFSNVIANHTISATFAKIVPTPPMLISIVASAGPGGSISPSGTVTAKIGDRQTFKVNADRGYKVDTVLVDGRRVPLLDKTYTFRRLHDDHTISVSFKKGTRG